MLRLVVLAVIVAAALLASAQAADEEPRVVVGLHDSSIHSASLMLAKPALTYLGLVLEPHDSADPLPDLSKRTDVRGVLIWLDEGRVQDGAGFATWVKALAQRDVPVVLMGVPPDVEDRFGLFLSLGLIFAQDERSYTYDLRAVDRDPDIVDFERRFDNLFERTDLVRPLDPALSRSLLVLQRRSDVPDRTHPLIITPKGGYAADGYIVWRQPDGNQHRWYIDPVAFFRGALRMDGVPAPDITTLNARRILAPRLAPVTPADRPAVASVLRQVQGVVGEADLRVVDTPPDRASAFPIPSPGQLCRDKLRAILFGYEGAIAALDDLAVPYRMAPVSPTFTVCTAESNRVPAAIRAILTHAAARPLIPDQGQLEAIEADFPNVKLDRLSQRTWRVRERGHIQTIRFDGADDLRIAWPVSDGVLGGGRVGGSLYVSLDPESAEPVIALTEAPWETPPFPTLVESRWFIERLVRDQEGTTMTVTGSGPGDMVWSTDPGSRWEIRLSDDGETRRLQATADERGLLSLSLPAFTDGSGTLDLVRHGDIGAP